MLEQVVGSYNVQGRELVNGRWQPVTYRARIERQPVMKRPVKEHRSFGGWTVDPSEQQYSIAPPTTINRYHLSGDLSQATTTRHRVAKKKEPRQTGGRKDWYIQNPTASQLKTYRKESHEADVNEMQQNSRKRRDHEKTVRFETPRTPAWSQEKRLYDLHDLDGVLEAVGRGDVWTGPYRSMTPHPRSDRIPMPPQDTILTQHNRRTRPFTSFGERGPVGTSLRMQRSVTQVEMAPKSPEKRLQEAIRLHWTKVKARCQKKDVAKKGMCTVQDFIDAFEGYAPSLSPAEWDSVLPAFGLRKGGKMAYITFLKNHVLTLNAVTEGCPVDERRKLQDTKVQTPQSQLLIGPGVKTDGFMAVMFQLRPLVLGSWKDLRRAFRTLDPRGLGVVNPVQFRSVLQRYGMPISEDNFYHLLSYYDKKLEGRIPYNDFIGAFLRTA